MIDFTWQNIFKVADKEESLKFSLRQNNLFKDLSTRELRIVEKTVHQRRFRSGEIVFRQGEAGVGMYIIMSGSVSIFVEELNPEDDEIRRILVAQLSQDDFFGELALIEDGGRRTATAVAQEETQLIGFFKPDLLSIVERNPSAGVKILTRLAEIVGLRLKETTKKVSELKKEVRTLQAGQPGITNEELSTETHTS